MQSRPNSSTAPAQVIDARFLRRVYIVSLLMIGLGSLVALTQLGGRWALGFAAAGLWAVANLLTLEVLVRTALIPGQKQLVPIVIAGVVKIPVLYGVGLIVAFKGGFPPVAMIAGVSVPLAVVVLKVFGQILATRMALPSRSESVSPGTGPAESRVSR